MPESITPAFVESPDVMSLIANLEARRDTLTRAIEVIKAEYRHVSGGPPDPATQSEPVVRRPRRRPGRRKFSRRGTMTPETEQRVAALTAWFVARQNAPAAVGEVAAGTQIPKALLAVLYRGKMFTRVKADGQPSTFRLTDAAYQATGRAQ